MSSFSTGTQSILRRVYHGSAVPVGREVVGDPETHAAAALSWYVMAHEASPEAFRNTEGMELSLWRKPGVRINKI